MLPMQWVELQQEDLRRGRKTYWKSRYPYGEVVKNSLRMNGIDIRGRRKQTVREIRRHDFVETNPMSNRYICQSINRTRHCRRKKVRASVSISTFNKRDWLSSIRRRSRVFMHYSTCMINASAADRAPQPSRHACVGSISGWSSSQSPVTNC